MKTKLFFLVLVFGIILNINAQIPTDGLVGYWPFNGNANDESGNGNNGIPYGVNLTSDRFGNSFKAYDFNGIDNNITVSFDNDDFPYSQFSIALWAKANGLQTDYAKLICVPIDTSTWNYPYFYFQIMYGPVGDGINHFNLQPSDGIDYALACDVTELISNVWQFLVVTFNAGEIKYYVDGIFEDSCSISIQQLNFNSKFSIGSRNINQDANNGEYFNGTIDDIRFYNRYLNESEINAIYTENTLPVCSDTTFYDTTLHYVSDAEFVSISPKVYLESIDSLYSNLGGCDSIIHHYSKFEYNPNHCTDTVWVNDTVTIEVFDTTFVAIYDSIAVTDTLIIDVTITGINPPNNINTLKVYPNPARDFLYINSGSNYQQMTDYKIKIISTTGVIIFESDVTQQLFEIDISDFGQLGLYFIQIIDNTSQIIDIRKIILE
jgi:hypothetical protein